MKVLFCIAQLDFADHIAISYLSAVAKNVNCETFFCSLDSSDLSKEAARIKPDVVAYSVNIQGFSDIVAAHKKAIESNSFISIMGGPHPTFSPWTFSESGVDAYCVGEGEGAFSDFLQRVINNQPFDDIANLITKNASNSVRPLIDDLATLPSPDRELVLSNSFLKDTPKKTFYATRGCPFTCSYCCNNYYHDLYKGKGAIVRRFPVENLIREIESVKNNYRTTFIKFGDDLFTMKADSWFVEFSQKYAKRINLPFNCFLRLDTVDDELLNLLKQAGCYSVHLSVDSVSERIREKVLGRRMRKINIVETLRKIQSYGINTWVNYMLAAPESTLEDDLNTIKMSKQAKVTYSNFSTTVPMKGTALYDYSIKHGCIKSNYNDDMTGCVRRSTLSCFSEKEKDIRYNIFLLGCLVSKLKGPLYNLGLFIIKNSKPNKFYKKIKQILYNYYIMNKIFKLPKKYRKISNKR
ncbi:MAG: B12-binding domain-containing radical SAM protein [Candidatus Omnitrophica bacterium]|nr:B12-binding domain-containing radical SAM protein [Candidatus Omnitrophota bacterium]